MLVMGMVPPPVAGCTLEERLSLVNLFSLHLLYLKRPIHYLTIPQSSLGQPTNLAYPLPLLPVSLSRVQSIRTRILLTTNFLATISVTITTTFKIALEGSVCPFV